MLDELHRSVYSEEGVTKVLKVDRDIIDEDTDGDG